MHWPHLPAESVRPSRFNPPFCPWPECAAHKGPGSGFQRYGSYQKPSDYRRTCSRQTFSTTYYLKRPELLVAVASGLAACSAHRQIARSCHCAKTSVTRMAERLGRHAIVHDHWEVFIGRQDRALGIGTAVGATSWFVYDIDPAPHRGSGRRPDRTKEKETASPPKCSYIKSIRRTFRGLIPHVSADRRLVCNMDGRTDYIVAARAPDLRHRVDLRIYPNPVRGPKGTPRSPEAVVRDHAMFVVDSLHQFLRHTCSDHKRETISFGRRLESIVGRAHLMAVWKNFIKSRSERRPDRTTPAMRLGLTATRWRWEQVSESARAIYQKRWTRRLPGLVLKHAA